MGQKKGNKNSEASSARERKKKKHVNYVPKRGVTRATAISWSCRTETDAAASTSVKQSMMAFWQECTDILMMFKAAATVSKFRTWCKYCSYFFLFSLFFSCFSIVVIKCLALRATELRSEAVSERQHKLLPHISMNINCLLSTYLIISFQFNQHWEQRWLFFLFFSGLVSDSRHMHRWINESGVGLFLCFFQSIQSLKRGRERERENKMKKKKRKIRTIPVKNFPWELKKCFWWNMNSQSKWAIFWFAYKLVTHRCCLRPYLKVKPALWQCFQQPLWHQCSLQPSQGTQWLHTRWLAFSLKI